MSTQAELLDGVTGHVAYDVLAEVAALVANGTPIDAEAFRSCVERGRAEAV